MGFFVPGFCVVCDGLNFGAFLGSEDSGGADFDAFGFVVVAEPTGFVTASLGFVSVSADLVDPGFEAVCG